jgi:ubiquinone biosynthesis protein UbiJ
LNGKQLFLKEVSEKVGDKVSKRIIEEKVDQFAKHGAAFLFIEVMSLRREIEKLREEINSLTNEAYIYAKR